MQKLRTNLNRTCKPGSSELVQTYWWLLENEAVLWRKKETQLDKARARQSVVYALFSGVGWA